MRIEVPGTLLVLDGEPGGRVELSAGWKEERRLLLLGRDEVRWLREALQAFEVSPDDRPATRRPSCTPTRSPHGLHFGPFRQDALGVVCQCGAHWEAP